jgi:hypothetical protein
MRLEGDGFADVVEAADPGHGAFDAHAEAPVGDGAVAKQVEVPLGPWGAPECGAEQIDVGDALAAADDPSVALRGEHMDARSVGGALGSGSM